MWIGDEHAWLRKRMELGAEIGSVTQVEAEAKAAKLMNGPILGWLVKQARLRLIMGTFRYEARDEFGLSYEDKVELGLAKKYYERMGDKLKLYAETGNQEMLVDAFNYILLELESPSHESAHFESLERHD